MIIVISVMQQAFSRRIGLTNIFPKLFPHSHEFFFIFFSRNSLIGGGIFLIKNENIAILREHNSKAFMYMLIIYILLHMIIRCFFMLISYVS